MYWIGREHIASAVALRDWFHEHNMNVPSVNVITEGAHARRTRLMFEKALGKDIAVGIIAVPNPDYDQRRWWRYSDGVKEVSSETLAYIYARLFFHPSEPPITERFKSALAIPSLTMKIAVVGLGYVGLPLSLQFARSCVGVVGIDVDPKKVNDAQ